MHANSSNTNSNKSMKKNFSLFVMLFVALILSCQPIDQPNPNPGNGDNVTSEPSTPGQPVDTSLSAITFLPQGSDGAATVNGRGNASQAVIDLEITPKGAIASISKNWKTSITCTAKCGVYSVQMPLVGYKSNASKGTISVTVSGSNLPDIFFDGSTSATAVVTILDGEKSVSSNSIPLAVGEEPEDFGGLQKYAKENEVKVLSFNVRLDTSETDPTNNWPNRKEACVELIKDQKPSLIGFQEAKYTSQWLYLKEQLADEYDGWGLNRDTGKESGTGEVMGILYNKSKVQKIDGGTFWLSETPDVCSIGWDAACMRTATWGIFKHLATNRYFLYVNTHLDHKGTEARVKGLEQLAAFFGKYSAYPAILSGDMNVVATHDAFKVLTSSLMNNTRDVAPKDHTDTKNTYNAYGSGSPSVIDHIYCSKALQVAEYHTVDENYSVPYISDHYPIYAIIKIL